MTSQDGFDAVILLAHGARDSNWRKPFERLHAEVHARLGAIPVMLAFLELAAPTFEEAAAEVVRQGAQRVLVVPAFLAGGGHVTKDVPALVTAARARHPQTTFEACGPLGEEPEVAAAMASAVVRQVRR